MRGELIHLTKRGNLGAAVQLGARPMIARPTERFPRRARTNPVTWSEESAPKAHVPVIMQRKGTGLVYAEVEPLTMQKDQLDERKC